MNDEIMAEVTQREIDFKARLEAERMAEDKRKRALFVGICPDCGGELKRRHWFLDFISSGWKATCSKCGAVHRWSPPYFPRMPG